MLRPVLLIYERVTKSTAAVAADNKTPPSEIDEEKEMGEEEKGANEEGEVEEGKEDAKKALNAIFNKKIVERKLVLLKANDELFSPQSLTIMSPIEITNKENTKFMDSLFPDLNEGKNLKSINAIKIEIEKEINKEEKSGAALQIIKEIHKNSEINLRIIKESLKYEFIFDNIKKAEICNFLPKFDLSPPLIHTFFQSIVMDNQDLNHWYCSPLELINKNNIIEIKKKPLFDFQFETKKEEFPIVKKTTTKLSYYMNTFIPIQYSADNNLRWALVVMNKNTNKMIYFVPDTDDNAQIVVTQSYFHILKKKFSKITDNDVSTTYQKAAKQYSSSIVPCQEVQYYDTGVYICYYAHILKKLTTLDNINNIKTFKDKIPGIDSLLSVDEINYLRKYIALKVFDYWTENKKSNDFNKDVIEKKKAKNAAELEIALQKSATILTTQATNPTTQATPVLNQTVLNETVLNETVEKTTVENTLNDL